MIVPALGGSKAKSALDSRLTGATSAADILQIAHEVGCLPRGDAPERLGALTEALGALVRDFVDGSDRISETARFDASAAVAIHEALGELPLRIAGEDEFWTYLAVGPLFDVVRARYPDGNSGANPKNFGIGDLWDCLPRRLWYRAHVALDPGAADPYGLVRRGHVDFWISGLIRVLYGSNRPLARALVRFQYPKEGTFEGRGYSPSTLDVHGEGGIRTLYKRLRYFNATTELTVLDDDEALGLIRDLADDL